MNRNYQADILQVDLTAGPAEVKTIPEEYAPWRLMNEKQEGRLCFFYGVMF